MSIDALLVANRGEIARRIFRTCRAMGISTVAVYSDADRDAPFVREADEAVPLGGRSPAESYLRGDAVVDAARRAGADAVHPGYGFLSESAPFAQACLDAGLTWVGPPPAAIASMGSKLAARELMAAAGVPILPGADVSDVADDKLADAAGPIGLPLIVKATFGGGGRGMRLVRRSSELIAAVTAARREAESAFGDGAVFIERYVDRPRHIEVQVLADAHGTTVHLFERECSIQRRHQKIIEEAPSPFVGDKLRGAMGTAAIDAARAVGYVGAGTVEFIVAPDGSFFFLEMNTRLQVEHPVTEMITGLDLVKLQLLIAEGEPLPATARTPARRGHAIEARLYAEDPAQGFRPAPGRIHRFEVPDMPGLRVDSGVDDGSDVDANYDPMLAKVIAHGADRREAIRTLRRALRRARIHADVTNRDLLVSILAHPEFQRGDVDTAFLERHPPDALVTTTWDETEVRIAGVAAALASSAANRARAPVLAAVTGGFRNNRALLQTRRYDAGIGVITIEYGLGRDERIRIDGVDLDVSPVAIAPDDVTLLVDGVRRRFAVAQFGDRVYVDSLRANVALREVPRFPPVLDELAEGSLIAPMPGTVVVVDVERGSHVEAGSVLVVIEAMKMQHEVRAPAAGVVADVRVAAGDTVDAGTVLVVFEEDEG